MIGYKQHEFWFRKKCDNNASPLKEEMQELGACRGSKQKFPRVGHVFPYDYWFQHCLILCLLIIVTLIMTGGFKLFLTSQIIHPIFFF